MPDRLKGKRAFVTAAAAGIGRAAAIAFAREGATVFATDVDEKGLAALKSEGVADEPITTGMRCRCTRPGRIETPSVRNPAAAAGPSGREMFVSRQPMGRLGTAEEIAWLAVYLASDESAFTSGVAHVIDGG